MASETNRFRRSARLSQASATVRAIVRINREPLRRSAGAECTAAMGRLEEARAAWHRYEREDKPSFARWRAREFGPLLSEAREVEVQIRDRELLVHEVEMEMRRGFMDPHTAYRRVMARRLNPTGVVEETATVRDDAGSGRPLSDFEKETLFQEWVQKSLGTNPDKMDDQVYAARFEAFKSHMFRAKPPELPRNTARPAAASASAEKEEQEPEPPVDVRVKELYRLLVRRLHPDLRADGNVAASALWHEVQAAYVANDIAQLEILLALSDIESDRFSDQTSLSQMRSLLAELARALFALNDSLRQARDEDAWDFARAGGDAALRVRVQRQLQGDLRMRLTRLALLKRTIEGWAKSPLANRVAGFPEPFERAEAVG